MCKLDRVNDCEKFVGYKVVAKRFGEYYSVAMGFKYPMCGNVPVAKTQERLSQYFCNDILDSSYYCTPFEYKMVGRTCVFKDYDVARDLLGCIEKEGGLLGSAVLVIVQVEVSSGLLNGSYHGGKVVGGKNMRILMEVDETGG